MQPNPSMPQSVLALQFGRLGGEGGSALARAVRREDELSEARQWIDLSEAEIRERHGIRSEPLSVLYARAQHDPVAACDISP